MSLRAFFNDTPTSPNLATYLRMKITAILQLLINQNRLGPLKNWHFLKIEKLYSNKLFIIYIALSWFFECLENICFFIKNRKMSKKKKWAEIFHIST